MIDRRENVGREEMLSDRLHHPSQEQLVIKISKGGRRRIIIIIVVIDNNRIHHDFISRLAHFLTQKFGKDFLAVFCFFLHRFGMQRQIRRHSEQISPNFDAQRADADDVFSESCFVAAEQFADSHLVIDLRANEIQILFRF